jgi:hypothetical protein
MGAPAILQQSGKHQQQQTWVAFELCTTCVGKPNEFQGNIDFSKIMDVMCFAGQCLHFTQEEVQRSPVLTRLEANGASGAVPLPFPMKCLSLWKHRVVGQGLSADDLISVIEVRVAARQKLSRLQTHKLCLACCHQRDLHCTEEGS